MLGIDRTVPVLLKFQIPQIQENQKPPKMKHQVEGSELIHQIPDFDHLLIDLPSTIPILGVPKGGSDRSQVKAFFVLPKSHFFSQRTSSDVHDSEEIQNAPERCKYFTKKTFGTQNLQILMIIGSKKKSCGVPFPRKLINFKKLILGNGSLSDKSPGQIWR